MATNPLITLDSDQALHQFETLLDEPGRVFLVVLGDDAVHQTLRDKALAKAFSWRHVLWAPQPGVLYQRLKTLPLRPGVLPLLDMASVYGVSISVNNHICRVIKESNKDEIAQAFMLAETFMQP